MIEFGNLKNIRLHLFSYLASKKDKKMLQTLQNDCIRCIYKLPKSLHVWHNLKDGSIAALYWEKCGETLEWENHIQSPRT